MHPFGGWGHGFGSKASIFSPRIPLHVALSPGKGPALCARSPQGKAASPGPVHATCYVEEQRLPGLPSLLLLTHHCLACARTDPGEWASNTFDLNQLVGCNWQRVTAALTQACP